MVISLLECVGGMGWTVYYESSELSYSMVIRSEYRVGKVCLYYNAVVSVRFSLEKR